MDSKVHGVTKSQTRLSDLHFNFEVTRMGCPDGSAGKESACNAGDPSSIPGLGRSPGEGIGYPFQYSWASLGGSPDKEAACNVGDPWVRKICWRRGWQPNLVFLLGESPWIKEPSRLQS